MKKETIIVAGFGPVGKAMKAALGKKYNVRVADPKMFDSSYDQNGKVIFDRSGPNISFSFSTVNHALEYSIHNNENVIGIICCVATPTNEDGSCNVSNVENIFKFAQINNLPVLVKSTVDIETLVEWDNNIKLTFSPEFLSGSTNSDTVTQYQSLNFEIYGSNVESYSRFWEAIFKDVVQRDHWIRTDLFSAAFAKYVENSYLAVRVTFFNEMKLAFSNIESRLNVNSNNTSFNEMTRILGFDTRIGRSHMQVPGPDGKFGYGGHCLPKDTNALIKQAERGGFDMKLLKFVDTYNTDYFRGL